MPQKCLARTEQRKEESNSNSTLLILCIHIYVVQLNSLQIKSEILSICDNSRDKNICKK